MSLQIYLLTIRLPSQLTVDDCYEWFIGDKSCNGFSSSKTYEVLRPRDSIKAWTLLVWFKGSTPKHAFNMWIQILTGSQQHLFLLLGVYKCPPFVACVLVLWKQETTSSFCVLSLMPFGTQLCSDLVSL